MGHFLIPALLCFFLSFATTAKAELNPLLDKETKYSAVKVERVLSADTILISGDQRVILIGIQGPLPPRRKDVKRDEYGFIIPNNDPTTSIEEFTLRAAKELLTEQTVRLEFDVERRDNDGSLLAYVFLADGRLANVELLRQGLVTLKLRSPNLKYADQFRSAYQESRRDMKGMQGQW